MRSGCSGNISEGPRSCRGFIINAHLPRLALSLAFSLASAFLVFSLFTTDFFSPSFAAIAGVDSAVVFSSEFPLLFLRRLRLLDSTGASTLPSCWICDEPAGLGADVDAAFVVTA